MQVNNEKGFTLIELLAAIVLLAVLLIPLYGYLTQARGISGDAGIQSKAMTLAQSKMEQLLAGSWDSSSLSPGSHEEPLTGTPFKKRVWTISNDADNRLKRIEVTVEWRNLKDATEKFSIATFRKRR